MHLKDLHKLDTRAFEYGLGACTMAAVGCPLVSTALGDKLRDMSTMGVAVSTWPGNMSTTRVAVGDPDDDVAMAHADEVHGAGAVQCSSNSGRQSPETGHQVPINVPQVIMPVEQL